MLTSQGLGEAAERMAREIGAIRDRLNAADARLGDGDTGMTIARLVEAVQQVSAALPADIGEALGLWSRQCRQASGSTLAAVVAIGLSAAARRARAAEALDRGGIVAALRDAAGAIAERSGSAPGDKTMLDSLLEIANRLQGDTDAVGAQALSASARALDMFRDRPSKAGRARMYGGKSVGLDDPGMLAVHLLLAAAIDMTANQPSPQDVS